MLLILVNGFCSITGEHINLKKFSKYKQKEEVFKTILFSHLYRLYEIVSL